MYDKRYWRKEARQRGMAFFAFETDTKHLGERPNACCETSIGIMPADDVERIREFIQQVRKERATNAIAAREDF